MHYDRDFRKEGFDINTPMMNLIEENGFQVVPVLQDYIGEERCELEYYIEKIPHDRIGIFRAQNKKQDRQYKDSGQKSIGSQHENPFVGGNILTYL